MTCRMITADDAPAVARHRAQMFRDIERLSDEETELSRSVTEPWIADLIRSGHYVGWVVEIDGRVVAGGGAFVNELGPGPGRYRKGRGAHVANIYTEPEYRRRGIARQVMQAILAWCEENAMDQVTLAASDEGRALYEALGFRPTNDMRLTKS